MRRSGDAICSEARHLERWHGRPLVPEKAQIRSPIDTVARSRMVLKVKAERVVRDWMDEMHLGR